MYKDETLFFHFVHNCVFGCSLHFYVSECENKGNYAGQREAFCNVCKCKNSTKDVSEVVGCFELFLAFT